MSSEWPTVRLGDVAEVFTGFAFKGESYLPEGAGIRVVRGDNVTEHSLRWESKEKCWGQITEELKPYLLRVGDVVIGMDGSKVGKNFAAVSPSDGTCVLAQRVARVRGGKSLEQNFLRYVICNTRFTEYVQSIHTGTSIPHISKRQIESFEVPHPPYDQQVAVSSLLKSLDDRIALLRETNATLEAIAQAMFKSWFVDFDPVHAKQQGRAPEGMSEAIPARGTPVCAPGVPPDPSAAAALFPDSFEESELGLVPRGWKVVPVGDVVESVGGGTPDTKEPSYWEGGVHCWTTPKDLSGIQAPVLLTTERKLTDKGLAKVSSGLLPAGSLLLSSRAPIGYLAIAQVPMAINQGYIGMLTNSQLPPLFMLFWCRQNMEIIKGRANGSTFMEISKKAFRPIPAVVPPASVIDEFMQIAGAMFERIVSNEQQAQTLATLRDTLLPRLISGQLRIENIEGVV